MNRLTATDRLRLVIAIVVLAGVAGAGGLWYLFFRAGGPAPVTIATVSPTSGTASTVPGLTLDPSATGGAPTTGIDGTWNVDTSVGSFSDFTDSFVGYRVQEELANIGAQTAVGRTPDVSGSLTIAGTTITAVEIQADLSTLKSDDDRRDGQLRQQALETNQFPTATFSLTQPIELGSLPAEGQVAQVTATGDLTLHGQTKSVQILLQAKIQSGVIVVTGSIEIQFSDYGIAKPQSFIVLSVADHGTMELQLFFSR
jgi:polyisoprenoid-binding protein YceI